MRRILLVAAGGLAREVLAAVRLGGRHEVVGFCDDDPALVGTSIDGVPVVGGLDRASADPDCGIVVCAGRGRARRAIVNRLAGFGVGADRYTAIVHPSVDVPAGCAIGAGSIVLAQVAMTASVHIGAHVVVMPHVTLTHDVLVEDFATVCAGVSLGGSVVVGSEAYLGMNASVRERLTVGMGAVLGMGAALLSDLPAGETWVGVPARPIGIAAVPAMRSSR